MSNIIDSVQLSGVTYTLSAQSSGGNPTVELTQAEYNALVSAGTVSADTYYIITDAPAIDMSQYWTSAQTESAITQAVSGKQDTLIAGDNISLSATSSGTVISATGGGGGGGTVDTTITSGSSNAVRSSAIWSAVTFNKDVTLDFSGSYDKAINFPVGCTTIKVTVGEWESCNLHFYHSNDYPLGDYIIQYYGSVSVNNYFGDSTYTISGNVVTITWSTSVGTVSKSGQGTVVAVVSGAWVNENTYMKGEVNAIHTTLQNNINQKLDSTAYTPTVVDSALSVDSENPVQNKVLFGELKIPVSKDPDTVITWSDRYSTNFPSGCTSIVVNVPNQGDTAFISFSDTNNSNLGYYDISNRGDISVSNRFDGSTYTTSGTSVTITWDSSKNVAKLRDDMGNSPSVTAIGATTYESVKEALSGKLDTSIFDSVMQSYDTVLYGLSNRVTSAETSLSGKQDTLSAGTGIDITNNVISVTGGGGGGGKDIIAGRGITVTTGATADTVSFNLPISASTGNNSIAEGGGTTASGALSHAEGIDNVASGTGSHAEGVETNANGDYSHSEGVGTVTNNMGEHAEGWYNVSNTGNSESAQTLFSVGNGSSSARHNAFEIMKNGDIYCNNGTSDVKLQDYIQFKMVQITQAAYDALVAGGTVDSSTIYYIVN